jgi:hypothetical protein
MKVNPIFPDVKLEDVPIGGIFYDMTGEFFIKVRTFTNVDNSRCSFNAISTDGDHFCYFSFDEEVSYYPNASLNLM